VVKLQEGLNTTDRPPPRSDPEFEDRKLRAKNVMPESYSIVD